MTNKNDIRVIAIDADDTLWDCQSHFVKVEKEYLKMLSDYGTMEELRERFFSVESSNMDELGYGTKAFTLSLIENAIAVTHGEISALRILEIEQLGRSLLRLPATPLPGVSDTLRQLHESGKYRLVLFTKGDNLEQETKVERSGLSEYFDNVVIVSGKSEVEYADLCERFGVKPDQFMMVGNSFKSDIAPALAIGAHAAYIPFHVTWQHEKTEEFDHEHLYNLDSFKDLLSLLL